MRIIGLLEETMTTPQGSYDLCSGSWWNDGVGWDSSSWCSSGSTYGSGSGSASSSWSLLETTNRSNCGFQSPLMIGGWKHPKNKRFSQAMIAVLLVTMSKIKIDDKVFFLFPKIIISISCAVRLISDQIIYRFILDIP